LEVLQRLELEEPKLDWARTAIDRQVGQLTRLVDDLLDVSRIARGKISLQKAPLEFTIDRRAGH
jgi:K+-sensing histidine kinase KdpD